MAGKRLPHQNRTEEVTVIRSISTLALFPMLPLAIASTEGSRPPTRICIAPAVVEANTGNAAILTDAVRETFISIMTGPELEIVPLNARLESQVRAEARSAGCPYLLLTTVDHVRKSGGGGLGRMAGAAVHHGAIAAGGASGSVVGNVAGNAVAGAAGVAAFDFTRSVRTRDELTLKFRLESGGKQILDGKAGRRARSDGEDVLTQVVQTAAEELAAAVLERSR